MHKIKYNGDGTTTDFLFAFPFYQLSDVWVALNGRVLERTDFGVYPNEDMTGGTVIFPIAPARDDVIEIFRQITLRRLVDYQPTAKIDPEDLNTDFNILYDAMHDVYREEIDLIEWRNIHDNVSALVEYTKNLIEDKLSGGGVLGIYNNLVSVLADARPYLINDYGYITDAAPNEARDDYGVL